MKRENSKRYQRKTAKKTKVVESHLPNEKIANEMIEAELKVQKVRLRRYLGTGSSLFFNEVSWKQ